jgi:hypothetical protein
MRENGVRAVTGTCEACRREADVNVNALPESVTVPKAGQRLRCSSCGGKTIIDQAGMTYGPARWCFRKRRLEVGQSDGAVARHGAALPEQEPTTRSPEVLITRRGDRRLAAQHLSGPSSISCLRTPRDHGNARLQSVDDPTIAPTFAIFRPSTSRRGPKIWRERRTNALFTEGQQ